MKQKTENKPSAGLFTAILENARHPKSARAAKHIKDACDYFDGKEIEITIAEVGHFCEKSGPKTQSIHNNKNLCAYIRARHSEQNLGSNPSTGEVKFETSDPQAKAVVYALQSEVRRLEIKLQNLKTALVDAGDYDMEASMRTGKLVRIKPEAPAATSSEIIDVLRRFLAPEHLMKFGIKHLQERLIAVDRNNRVFMEKADLQRLLNLLESKVTSLSAAVNPLQLADVSQKQSTT